jgi:hypothetical protein
MHAGILIVSLFMDVGLSFLVFRLGVVVVRSWSSYGVLDMLFMVDVVVDSSVVSSVVVVVSVRCSIVG